MKRQSLIQSIPCLLLRARCVSTRKRASSSRLPPDPRRLFCFDGGLQRCDAKRPCTLCLENGRSEECIYGRDPVLQRVAQKSRPAGTSEDISLFNQSLPPSDISGSASSYPNPTLPCVSSREYDTPGEFGSHTPRERFMSEVVLYREATPKPRDRIFATPSSFSIHPFVRLPSIPRGPQIPLSFIDPELLRVSDATPSELNLSLYVFPLGVTATRYVR
jgi:hypothetical protein